MFSSFSKFIINAENISLRAVKPSDIDLYFQLASDEDTAFLSDDRKFAHPDINSYKRIFERYILKPGVHYYPMVIEHLMDKIPLGQIHAGRFDHDNRHAYVGFQILPRFRQRGYGSQALAAFVDHLFSDLELNRIAAEVYEFNAPSIAMLLQAGFIREGIMRKWVKRNDKFYDKFIYALLKDDWKSIEHHLNMTQSWQICILFKLNSDKSDASDAEHINELHRFYEKSSAILESAGAKPIWFRENIGLAALSPQLKNRKNAILNDLKRINCRSVCAENEVIIGPMGFPPAECNGLYSNCLSKLMSELLYDKDG